MDTNLLTDVQRANLTLLMTIRDSVRENPAAACCKFCLEREEMLALRDADPDALLEAVANAGQEFLFTPRAELTLLLTQPLPLLSAMAYARRPTRQNASCRPPSPTS